MWYNLLMRVFLCIVLYLIILLPCQAIEEVILEIDDNAIPEKKFEKIFEEDGKYTLYEKFQDIKAKEVKDANNSAYLLDGILTKKFETGVLETMHLFGYYRAAADVDLSAEGDTLYDFSAIQAGVNGKFRGGKNYYEARLRFDPVDGYSFLQGLPQILSRPKAMFRNFSYVTVKRLYKCRK